MTGLTQDQLRSDRNPPAWFFFMQTDTPVRIWSGVGDFRLPSDSVDTAGGVYRGLGIFVQIPSIRVPLNGAMIRHEFALSGVTAEVLRLANADRATVRGAEVFWGLTMLGPDKQPMASVAWFWNGVADTPKAARTGSQQPVTRTVSLSVGTGEVGRKQKNLWRWTGIDQRLRSPTDAFCDRVVLYNSQTTERWPT
ncbi:MAG TPA: hypothetical protein VGF56_05725 [Rhizomicrobium sp.]